MAELETTTTAQLENATKIILQEWDRIKRNPTSRLILQLPRQCSHCKQVVQDVKVCSACKMTVYCSPQCAKKEWKVHKVFCGTHKKDGEQIPKYKAIINQFPWTNIAYNTRGQFNNHFVLAQFGILGTSRQKVGYWAFFERGEGLVAKDDVLDAPWYELTEEKGWRLSTEHIPSLAMHNSVTCPKLSPTFEESWKSYYQWRGLPITSPAAILLHWPMSVYACLKELGLVPENSGPRKKLTVFYVGARDEICFIPVFGELALHFPNTDLDLVMFGQNAAHSVKRAKARGITQSPRPCVFEYTGPASCGSGTVRIFLDSNPAYYRPSRERSDDPDAIVALNAGLGSYISWQHVIMLSSEFDIPFVVTDYCEASLSQIHVEALEQALTSTLPPPKDFVETGFQAQIKKVIEEVKTVDVKKVCGALKRKRPMKLNEFMQPGWRGNSTSLSPGSCNAFIQVITPVARRAKVEVDEK
ncbi:hypothetical protein FB451DRAFT_1150240 [Mycena latifolia]|nr:hypothetical protein FB451DRAFT_1150240 [Mycena latifolia]